MSRPLFGFVAIVLVGALLQGSAARLSLGHWYWPAVLVVAATAAIGLASQRRNERRPDAGEFLCDSCKFNHERYCDRPERPNATRCDDYRAPAGE